MTTTSTTAPSAHLTTTRRSLLVAAPAVAIVASVPALAHRKPFDLAVADFRATLNRQIAAGNAHEAYERVKYPGSEMPTRNITYSFRFAGRTFETDHTLRPYDCDHPNPDIAAHPEFPGYCAEVKEWRDREAAFKAASNGEAIVREWEEAVDAHCAAWLALAACSAPTMAALAIKMELCGKDDARDCDGYMDTLIASIAADTRRLAGQA